MRARFFFSLLLSLGCFATAGCYASGDLGEEPFYCSKDNPECPDGYDCDLSLKSKNSSSPGKAVCVRSCANGETCNAGFHCDQNYGHCLPGN